MQDTDSAIGLREFTEQIVRHAMERLHREACGDKKIGNDFELRACIVLARLAPVLIGPEIKPNSHSELQEFPPDLDPQEAERLLRELQCGRPLENEGGAA